MNLGKTLFAQLMDFLPWKTFHRIVDRHDGDRYVKSMTCAEQFRVMAFAQLAYRESLRDIEVCLSPVHLRRIRFKDPESGKTLVFLTNNFALPAATICALYKARWQVELFFKWIKQHLRIKKFYGTSENAVKSQIWIAVSVYVLVAIVKKRLNLDASLYTLLQIFSLTLFEKMRIQQAFVGNAPFQRQDESNIQLNLFAF